MTDERVAHDPRHRSGPPARPAAALPPIPAPLHDLLTGAAAAQVWVKRESEVWLIDGPAGRCYLKIMDDLEPFADELDRLRWAEGRCPNRTPRVLGDALDEAGRGWFVASEVLGIPAHDPAWSDDPDALVRALADGLRRLHDTDPTSCPFVLAVDDFIASAEVRVASGGVDPTSMRTEAYRTQTGAQLLDHLTATRPPEPPQDQVLTHGDSCQPNLLLARSDGPDTDPELVGLVDLGRLAVTDRYRDLAIAARSLDLNLGPDAAAAFLDAYGPETHDHDRLTWWTLVDDLW